MATMAGQTLILAKLNAKQLSQTVAEVYSPLQRKLNTIAIWSNTIA